MSTDNSSKPPDRLPSQLTTAEHVTDPVGSKPWDTPPQDQDASPIPGHGMPETPATPVEAEPAGGNGIGILMEQVDYATNNTPIADLLPPGAGPAMSAIPIIIDTVQKRDPIMHEVKEVVDKGKAIVGDVRDDLLDKGRVVGRATAEAMGEMVHQVYGDPQDPTVGRR